MFFHYSLWQDILQKNKITFGAPIYILQGALLVTLCRPLVHAWIRMGEAVCSSRHLTKDRTLFWACTLNLDAGWVRSGCVYPCSSGHTRVNFGPLVTAKIRLQRIDYELRSHVSVFFYLIQTLKADSTFCLLARSPRCLYSSSVHDLAKWNLTC